MKEYYSITIYRCVVAGEPTDSLDVSARYHRASSEE